MEMLGLCSCVCVFFFSWVVFVGSVFEIFIENQRPRFFHRLGMKTLIFRLGMPPEWRHGDDSNTWEFWDITQGDLKHCLQYACQSHCLGSRHVIIRTSGFYAFMLVEIPWEPFLSISWTGVVLLGLGTSQRRNVGMFWLMTPQLSNVLVFPFANRVWDCRGCLVVPASWAAIQCFWISFQPMLLLIWFYTHRLSGRPWTMRIWSWRSVRRQPIHWNLASWISIEKRMDFMTWFLFQQVTSSSFTVKSGFLYHILSNNNKKTIEIETWTKISEFFAPRLGDSLLGNHHVPYFQAFNFSAFHPRLLITLAGWGMARLLCSRREVSKPGWLRMTLWW